MVTFDQILIGEYFILNGYAMLRIAETLTARGPMNARVLSLNTLRWVDPDTIVVRA